MLICKVLITFSTLISLCLALSCSLILILTLTLSLLFSHAHSLSLSHTLLINLNLCEGFLPDLEFVRKYKRIIIILLNKIMDSKRLTLSTLYRYGSSYGTKSGLEFLCNGIGEDGDGDEM